MKGIRVCFEENIGLINMLVFKDLYLKVSEKGWMEDKYRSAKLCQDGAISKQKLNGNLSSRSLICLNFRQSPKSSNN